MPYNSSRVFGQTLWVAQVGSTLDVMSLGIDTMFNRKGEIKRQYHMDRMIWLVGLEHDLFFHILGMSSSQLTSSYFSEGWLNHQPDMLESLGNTTGFPMRIFPETIPMTRSLQAICSHVDPSLEFVNGLTLTIWDYGGGVLKWGFSSPIAGSKWMVYFNIRSIHGWFRGTLFWESFIWVHPPIFVG